MKSCRKFAAGLLLLTAALPVVASAHPPIAAEAAAANFEQDRADILAMAGNYRVSFNMQESTRWDPTYEVLEPKRSGGNEVVRVIEEVYHPLIDDPRAPRASEDAEGQRSGEEFR